MSTIAIIGAGPAGLSAAEILSGHGHSVTLFERMPSVARKFLLAGRGGLNLTHSEPLDAFLGRYGAAQTRMAAIVATFPPDAVQTWCSELGEATFTGSSGRVFPKSLKASPLLRAWLRRLADQGVQLRTGHRWTGWNEQGDLLFETASGVVSVSSKAVILALGGASWPRLGSDGGWVGPLQARGVTVETLRPANGGFTLRWSAHFSSRFAGSPLKRIALSFAGVTVRGEAMITAEGIEGGAIYALSARLREAILAHGKAVLLLDLRHDLSMQQIIEKLGNPRAGESFSNHLRKRLALPPVVIALLREFYPDVPALPPARLAALIKALPVTLTGIAPIERAISSAGGIHWDCLDDHLMLKALPGVFCAGEMLDWEAPTGGYLLQGCFASGRVAAHGVSRLLAAQA
ncbi:MAG: TIGR03862 family flavoprotein [Beijerinckiaceae bacterium]